MYIYTDHIQVMDCDTIGCIYVVRVVVKQFNWSSYEILCSQRALLERDCIRVTYHFHNYHTLQCCVTRIRLALATATNFLTSYIEAVVPWHITVPRKPSKFVRTNIFSVITSFTDRDSVRQNRKPATLVVISQDILHPFNKVTPNGDWNNGLQWNTQWVSVR